MSIHTYVFSQKVFWNTGKRNFKGVPQSQAAALSKHEEEEEKGKTKQAQIG